MALLSVETVFFLPRGAREKAEKAIAKFRSAEGDHATLLSAYQNFKVAHSRVRARPGTIAAVRATLMLVARACARLENAQEQAVVLRPFHQRSQYAVGGGCARSGKRLHPAFRRSARLPCIQLPTVPTAKGHLCADGHRTFHLQRRFRRLPQVRRQKRMWKSSLTDGLRGPRIGRCLLTGFLSNVATLQPDQSYKVCCEWGGAGRCVLTPAGVAWDKFLGCWPCAGGGERAGGPHPSWLRPVQHAAQTALPPLQRARLDESEIHALLLRH